MLNSTASWRGMFRDLPREHSYEPLRIEGRVPDEVCGALYRCGPARFAIGGEPYRHWFDGDGAITAVRFDNGRAEGAVRTIETRWLREELAANRKLYRSYGQIGRGWRRWGLPKNAANVALLRWDRQLLALWEAGLPIAVDPDTLDCRGETDLEGRIGPTLAAHPHRAGDTLVNFAVRYGARFSLDLYAFGDGVRRIGSIPLARPTMIHDFIATPRHLVFFCSPLRLRVARFLAGIGTYEENLAWEPRHGTEVVVVPLAQPEKPIRFTVDPFFQWHFVNAWEPNDGRIVVDYLPYDDFETNDWFGRMPYAGDRPAPPSSYARATIEPALKRMEVEVLAEHRAEFPSIDPAETGTSHKSAWLLCFDTLPPSLCRFDVATGTWREVPLGDQTFASEPIVVPRRDEPEGWVLTQVYDGTRDASCVAVIDGARPEDGPVARAWFDHAIPFNFHGTWAER